MSTHRYAAIGPDEKRLQRTVDPGASVNDTQLVQIQVDVTLADDSRKSDLDNEMSQMGWKFLESSPSGDPTITLKSPDATQWEIKVTDDGDLEVDNGAGTVQVFGNNFLYIESLDAQTTTGTSYVQKLRLTTPTDLPDGDYIIWVSYNWSYSHNSSAFMTRVQVDDTTTIMEHEQDPQASNIGQKLSFSQFCKVSLTPGGQDVDFDLDFAAGLSGKTAKIFNARMMFWRIS